MSTVNATSVPPVAPSRAARALVATPGFFIPMMLASIRQTMQDQHVSQAELARRTGYSYTTIQRKLAGKSRLFVPDLVCFARALNDSMLAWTVNVELAAQWVVESLGSSAGLDDVDALARSMEVDPYELLKATMDVRAEAKAVSA